MNTNDNGPIEGISIRFSQSAEGEFSVDLPESADPLVLINLLADAKLAIDGLLKDQAKVVLKRVGIS